MPEEIEFESPAPHEEIDTHDPVAETFARGWTRFIPLSTAMLAVIAAIASLQSATLVNEALLEQSLAVQAQAQASDAWAYYQAKGIKGNTAAETADLLSAQQASAAVINSHRLSKERYQKDQRELEIKAHEFENLRDERNRQSQDFMHRHHPFAYCVTFTQIAIALSAIAALTRRRSVWYFGLAAGVIGLVFFVRGAMG